MSILSAHCSALDMADGPNFKGSYWSNVFNSSLVLFPISISIISVWQTVRNTQSKNETKTNLRLDWDGGLEKFQQKVETERQNGFVTEAWYAEIPNMCLRH